MATYEEVLRLARGLGAEQQRRLAGELSGAAPGSPAPGLTPLGTLAERPPAPHSVAWLKAERGHAVLATDLGENPPDLPPGADAIAGMWADVKGEVA